MWADSDLVGRAVRGEPAATATLLAEVRPGVVRYCRARLGPVGGGYTTADDLSQEVCIAVLRALPRYRDQGLPFSAFVYGIAARKIADAQRSALRRLTLPVDGLPDPADPAPGPEQAAIAADQARRLARLLQALPATQREILVLRIAVGLSAAEVGSVLNMSPVAVRVAQSRALSKLRSLAGRALSGVSS